MGSRLGRTASRDPPKLKSWCWDSSQKILGPFLLWAGCGFKPSLFQSQGRHSLTWPVEWVSGSTPSEQIKASIWLMFVFHQIDLTLSPYCRYHHGRRQVSFLPLTLFRDADYTSKSLLVCCCSCLDCFWLHVLCMVTFPFMNEVLLSASSKQEGLDSGKVLKGCFFQRSLWHHDFSLTGIWEGSLSRSSYSSCPVQLPWGSGDRGSGGGETFWEVASCVWPRMGPEQQQSGLWHAGIPSSRGIWQACLQVIKSARVCLAFQLLHRYWELFQTAGFYLLILIHHDFNKGILRNAVLS